VTAKTCPSCHRPLPSDAPGGLCPACVLLGASGEIDPPGVPSIGEIQSAFPQFEILECIGRGGMGVVYKVRQPQLDRLLALKILLPGLDHDPGFAERFSREARALAKLGHSNIVAIHDFGETGGYFWLTMEYVDGVNLRQAMQAARFTPAQALALIPDLCAALQYAHDHGILHRDIKPENILLDTRGRVKVADFGIARIVGDDGEEFTLTKTDSVLGSAAYIAPEQIERPQDVDHRADLYSLGVVFYEMLTGELPLGRFPAPSEKSSSAPQLDEVVFRILEKERERRYQSADALKEGVQTAESRPADRDTVRKKTHIPLFIALSFGGLVLTGMGHLVSLAALGRGWFFSPDFASAESGLDHVRLITGALSDLIGKGITGLGLLTFIGGQIGCWVRLSRMKSGREEITHRALLRAAAFIPTLLVLVLVVFNPRRDFTDLIYSRQPVPLLWVFLAFVIVACSGRFLWKLAALPGLTEENPRLQKATTAGGIIGTALLILGLLLAKHAVVNLSLLNGYNERTYNFRQARTSHLGEEDTKVVKKAIGEAAGPYARFYHIGFPLPSRSLTDSGDQSKSMGISMIWDARWASVRSEAHLDAFGQRLRSLLPPRIRITSVYENFHIQEIATRQEKYSTVARTIPWMAAFASVLVIFTARKLFFCSLGCGMVAVVIFNSLDFHPKSALLPLSLADRPPLPLLPAPPAPDATDAVTTFRRIQEAAKSGDLAAVKLGMSEEVLLTLNEKGAWEDALAWFSEQTIFHPKGKLKTYRENENEPWNTSIYVMGAGRGGSLDMIFEDGEWRVSEQPWLP
jgi:serine/threonine protein kinase